MCTLLHAVMCACEGGVWVLQKIYFDPVEPGNWELAPAPGTAPGNGSQTGANSVPGKALRSTNTWHWHLAHSWLALTNY